MKKLTKICFLIGATISMMLSGSAFANLIVNGGFEASTSPTMTPPGWTNIGHSEGVIAYSEFGTPAFEGLYFYDLGGFGDSSGPVGDGIMQNVATTPGTTYTLEFGLTSENGAGSPDTTLTVCLNLSCFDFTQGVDPSFGNLAKPFSTQAINFLATDALTAISFVESINPGIGSNDPMIDNVIFDTGPDTDGDAVPDSVDNCTMLANPDQRDTDGDGFGNRCDADLDDDCIVNPVDLGLFKSVFFSADPDADLNGDGIVNSIDLGIFRSLYFLPPGPSGLASCP